MLARGAIIDVLFSEDDCLALTHDGCLRLNAVAAEALAHLAAPRTPADVREHLGAVFGPAPDGAFDRLLEDLTQHRLVSQADAPPGRASEMP